MQFNLGYCTNCSELELAPLLLPLLEKKTDVSALGTGDDDDDDLHICNRRLLWPAVLLFITLLIVLNHNAA